jgi:lipoprotein NlpD
VRRHASGILVLFLAACAEDQSSRAPVSDRMEAIVKAPAKTVPLPTPLAKAMEPEVRAYRDADWRPKVYVVKKGDTLYSIALDHGEDYRDVARWNGIADPAVIKIGQELNLVAPADSTVATSKDDKPTGSAEAVNAIPVKAEPKPQRVPYNAEAGERFFPGTLPAERPKIAAPIAKPTPAAVPQVHAEGKAVESADALAWVWPAQGKMVYEFGAGNNKKGVGIEGKSGQAISAAAAGKVVYSGSGLRGYGKMVIIKHNAMYLSVYAHNKALLVREGQKVNKGQRIAEMGDSESDRTAFHFEIRRFGKPVDPLTFLPAASKS